MPFPAGDYTPFGYLSNPGHRASAGWQVVGGNLRTAPEWVGVEWVYPTHLKPTGRAGLRLETVVEGRACRSRADFDALGLTSRYHSSLILGFDWRVNGMRVAVRCFLVDADTLCTRIEVSNLGPRQEIVSLGVLANVDGDVPDTHTAVGMLGLQTLNLASGAARTFNVLLVRGAARGDVDDAPIQSAYERALAADDAFYASCPELAGDWPAHWREGLIHDFETTRALVQPAGGVFGDVWPTWMATYPRIVLAEGTLDMLRLGYADPALAERAILTMFQDAPSPQVPCIFEDGSCNMLAADGSWCGTSPAWCLPFLNLELLYLRTLDRSWLAALYPALSAYVEWWLTERVDARGWLVYRCTWEAGEDGNPRLDPTGTGDAVIADRVRPVELQASMAHAARVLAFFAGELGRAQDIPRWRRLERAFRARTRQLFDPVEGRYRDWLIDEQRFQTPRPEQPYWGIDACRFAPLSLTPLLIGEPLAADEVRRHATPPWTLWPSWTYALVECAAAAGLDELAADVATEIVDRVYRVTTRRELGSLARPLPGSAPEFWPADWRTFDGHDAYGWGATTANLLLRHVVGVRESRVTSRWTLDLRPQLPMNAEGGRFAVRRLVYRGVLFDLEYEARQSTLAVTLELRTGARRCRVRQGRRAVYRSGVASTRHVFVLERGALATLELAA